MALRGTEQFLCGVNSAPPLQAQPLLPPGPPQHSSPAPCHPSHRFLAPGEGGTGCARCPRASRWGKPLGGSLMLGKIRVFPRSLPASPSASLLLSFPAALPPLLPPPSPQLLRCPPPAPPAPRSSGAWARTDPCAECVRSQLRTSPGHAGVLKTQPQHCRGWAETLSKEGHPPGGSVPPDCLTQVPGPQWG
ncbi:hypothetical protein LUU34_00478900 [Aix galericulata]|nr:hypothetical protein LUU34_00478900 [Aix galericulata]